MREVFAFYLITIIFNIIKFLKFNVLKSYLLKKILKSINAKVKIKAEVKNIKISFDKIKLEELTAIKGNYQIEIDLIEIGFENLMSKKLCIKINEIKIDKKNGENQSSYDYYHSIDKDVSINNIVKNYESLINKNISTRVCFLIDKINFIDKFTLKNLHFSKNRIYFKLYLSNNECTISSYYFLAIVNKKNTLNFRVKPLEKSDFLGFYFFKVLGFIRIENRRVIFKYYVTNVIISNSKICDDEIKLPFIDSSLIFDLKKSEISLNDESYIFFSGNYVIPIISFSINNKGFISSVFYLKVKLESILTLIPNLKFYKLYSLKSDGFINIQIKYAFLLKDPLSYSFKLNYDLSEFTILSIDFDLKCLEEEFECKSIKILKDLNYHHTLVSKVIQMTEDPSFYKHIGIDEYNIGKAIVLNISKKRFVKGASTITMQLVKNLFLENSKKIVRKFEELVLTLLIENYFKIDKNRILEIYLQIIPFSSIHYGIEEASKFYFNKNVDAINLLEAIVLSYIIPRPLYFLEAVENKSEQLDRNLSNYINYYRPFFIDKFKIKDDMVNWSVIKLHNQLGVISLSYINC